MAVELELYGQLLPNKPRRQTLNLEQPMTVSQLAVRLGLDQNEIGLIVIDGQQCELEDPVPSTCRLCFFPPVSGG